MRGIGGKGTIGLQAAMSKKPHMRPLTFNFRLPASLMYKDGLGRGGGGGAGDWMSILLPDSH